MKNLFVGLLYFICMFSTVTVNAFSDEEGDSDDSYRTPQEVYCPLLDKQVTVCVGHEWHGCGSLRGCQ